jgi:hypothetical protein
MRARKRVQKPYCLMGVAIVATAIQDFWTHGLYNPQPRVRPEKLYQDAKAFFSPQNRKDVACFEPCFCGDLMDKVRQTQDFIASGGEVSVEQGRMNLKNMKTEARESRRKQRESRVYSKEEWAKIKEDREKICALIRANWQTHTHRELASMCGVNIRAIEHKIYYMRKKKIL